jgi:hypothetical protein
MFKIERNAAEILAKIEPVEIAELYMLKNGEGRLTEIEVDGVEYCLLMNGSGFVATTNFNGDKSVGSGNTISDALFEADYQRRNGDQS